MNLGAIWKSDWLISATLTVLFTLAYQQGIAPLKHLENTIYDAFVTDKQSTTDNQIVILNIKTSTLRTLELSPQQAATSAINKLTSANARLIGIDSAFHKVEQRSDNSVLFKENQLEKAIRDSGNTILPISLKISMTDTQNSTTLPTHLNAITLKHVNTSHSGKPISATSISPPYKQLSLTAAGIGHMNILKDSDGIVRSEALIIAYGKHYLPSFTLLFAAKTLDVSLDDIRINAGKNIEVGPLNIAIDAQNRIYPSFLQSNNDDTFFHTYTFKQLYDGKIPDSVFNNKVVLISTTQNNPETLFSTPSNDSMSRIEFSAHVLQSLLHQKTFQRPSWTQSTELALLLIIGLYLIYLLPRLTTRASIVSTGLICIALFGADIAALEYYAVWLQTMTAILLLFIGHITLSCKHKFALSSSQKKPAKDLHKTNKLLGISFQNQGMLEQAFEKFITCPIDEEMLTILDKLAIVFERKRQFKQAITVYNHIATHNPDYQDIKSRMASAKNNEETPHGKESGSALSTLLLTGKNKATLGRYKIISELGKGAMGTVYLGRDPKINRKVAIKTMALSQEFEPEELEEVKSKFFHEAEIAGMLNHPNIVTIFDAGDEHDLAYIAMEFLDGIDLSPYTKKDRLLPFPTTLKVIGKVAEALQYAHDHGVIHRDIKPANIMILKNKSVKVTDFGIAHIIDCSKAKAGVVLGTPSYMSPEQLSGKTLDGRSDLFSLGVMLYELASGTRPFRADSLSKLMYKIAKQPHVNIREHNPDVPDCICVLIDELLTKKADQRIETANDVLEKVSLALQALKRNGESQ